jgi:hypothetical protein
MNNISTLNERYLQYGGEKLDGTIELRGFYDKCIKRKVWFVILWQHSKYVLMTFCVMVGPFTLANKLVVLFESWEKDMLMQ